MEIAAWGRASLHLRHPWKMTLSPHPGPFRPLSQAKTQNETCLYKELLVFLSALLLTIRKGAKQADRAQESGTGSLPGFFQIGQLTTGCFGTSHLAHLSLSPPSPHLPGPLMGLDR